MRRSEGNLYAEFLSHFIMPFVEPCPLEPRPLEEPQSLDSYSLECYSPLSHSLEPHPPDHTQFKEDGLLVLSNIDPLLRKALLLLSWKPPKTTNRYVICMYMFMCLKNNFDRSYELYMRLKEGAPVINTLNRPITDFIEDIISDAFKTRFYEVHMV